MVHIDLSEVSKFLTTEVVDKAFKKKTNSNDSIEDLEISRAAAAGEGLISAVYRLNVSGKTHKVSFVVKSLVKNDQLRKSLRNSEKYFEREITFFSRVLPTLIEVQKSLGANECIQHNVPICYGYHIDGNEDFILLEDLAESNCNSLNENTNKTERDAILKVLAHLHAVSMALRIKKPQVFGAIKNSIPEIYYTEENKDWYCVYFQNAINILQEALGDVEDRGSEYYKKYAQFKAKDVYDELIKLSSESCDHLVICHGDAWSPNFMCSDERAIAIDFQLLRCASPMSDIMLFLCMCMKLFQEKDDLLDAIKYYHHCVSNYLRDMNLNPDEVFSWNDLNKEMKKFGRFGVLASLSSLSLLYSNQKCDNMTFESKDGDNVIPLEDLWKLVPIEGHDQKMQLAKAMRVTVDVGLI